MLEFGSLLRVFRTALGLKQAEMAEYLCMSQPAYSRMESGQRPVSIKTLQRVAERSGISLQLLLLAHLFLDENLEEIEKNAADELTRILLDLSKTYRQKFPETFKNAAALAIFYENASE